MKSLSPIVYIAFLISLFWGSNSGLYAQIQSEKELIRGVRETKDKDVKILRMIQLGEFYSDLNLKKAESLRKRINYLAKNEGSTKTFEIDLYNAKIFKLQRNFDGFFNRVFPYKDKNISSYSVEKRIEILQNLGYLYVLINDYNQAKIFLQKSLSLAASKKIYSEIGRSNCYLAFNEMNHNNKEKALEYLELALEAAKKTRKKIDFAFAYLFQSFVYNYFGQPEIAISKELTAYTYAQEAQNYSLMALISNQIGDKQIDIENFKEASYYYERAYDHSLVYQDPLLQGLALTSKANAQRLMNQIDESLSLNRKAFQILKKVGSSNELGLAELHYAQIYIDKKAFTEALVHLNRSLKHYTENGDKKRIREINFYTGVIYKERKQYSEALQYLTKSIDKNGPKSFSNESSEVYPLIAEIYKAQGNNKKALENLEKYAQLTEKSNRNQTSRRIAELNELYRSEQRDALISQQNKILESQKRERELTKTKLENVSLRNILQTYVIIAFVIILILVTIIGIFRIRQAAIQQKRREAEMSQVLLRTQMNPHFIFNAMSVIQSYIFENDTKNSSKFLVSFSRLIRLILENSPKAFINLETEIEILQKYLETQKHRFEDRFDFEIICPEALFFDNVQIPPMITQPFVENSIEHGQLHTLPDGKITVQFSKQDKMLHIRIEDNGIGRAKSEEFNTGKGHNSMALNITRNRINMINEKYKSAGSLTIMDSDEEKQSGTKVLISLPYVNKHSVTT